MLNSEKTHSAPNCRKASVLFLALLTCVMLQVQAPAQNENPAQLESSKTIKLNPLPLNHVRLTGGPLRAAQDADAKYLLELEPDRMLAFLRQRAGLKPKAEGYGGWDGPGRNLTGHIAGHYLSAVSLMWAATGDVRFKERANYIVEQLKEIQDAQGDGYIGALLDGQGVDGKQRFVDLSNGVIKSGGFDLNGLWSPWYVEHKLFAGLREAYRYTDNATALQVEIKFAGWAEKTLSKLNDDQLQHMLATEFGGMNEVLAELYADTADERWLTLADKFHQKSIVDPLSEDKDSISHTHGNTQVPKLYGVLMRYVYTGNASDEEAAKYFWDRVVNHYTFATGGHGKNEYFGEPDKLYDMVDGRTAESCNVYNMLKMTRTLFSVDPEIRYADFHERALFNHILASQDPNDGTVSYMLPVGRGVRHEYQRKFAVTRTVALTDELREKSLYGPLMGQLAPDPLDDANRLQIAKRLADAIQNLPLEQREVIALWIAEVEPAAIAEITGAPRDTVLSRKKYALAKLRSALSDLLMEGDHVRRSS